MSKIDLVNELHRQARKNFLRRKTVMRGICDTLQADLVEMQPYAKQNNGYKYILVVINIFSKKAYACPLKSKTGEEVANAMESILDSIPLRHSVKNLHVDQGKEFYNRNMESLLRQHNINIYSTFTTKKASIVERFNRTLKNAMWKMFSLNGSYKWFTALNKLIYDYNNAHHRTIAMAPNKVNLSNERHLLDTVYNRKIVVKEKTCPRFKIGDHVRISKYKHLFEKGYTPNWTAELFKINKVRFTNPITYELIDLNNEEIKGTFYNEELQLTKHPNLYLVEKIVKKRGDMVYVKWLGLDKSQNSWIKRNNII